MTYRTRIGILIGFIVLFLVLTPVVILYTAGYRWNEKKFRLEKVGIIFLRSKPTNADIYLNGKLRKESTVARLRDLIPDTYTIKVAKDGYTSWTKKLSVESAHTTFAEGITLWKNSEPEKLNVTAEGFLTANELASLNRNNQLEEKVNDTYFKSNGFEIWTAKENGENRETITRLSEEIHAISPYTDTGWIIYQTASAIYAIERDGRDMRNEYKLVSGDNLNGLAVSSDGKMLYYYSGIGAQKSLWRRALQ